MRKSKILITGIGGSIGCHATAHILKNTDWDIVGIDSFRHFGLTDRLYEILKDRQQHFPRVTVYGHDLTAPISEGLRKQIGDVDYILNLASLSDVQGSIDNPEPFIFNNVQLMTTILEFARKVKPKAFVQFSTDEVYGPSGEGEGHPEWSPILPSNPYAASKACQEAIAISYWRSYGVPIIITNTMNNFGELQQPNKYPVKIQRAVAKGETVLVHGTKKKVGSRFYLHSRNAIDAVLFILKNTAPTVHVEGAVDRPDRYNIVGDKRLSNLELAQTIAKLMGKKLKYKFVDFHKHNAGHDRHYGLDGARLKELGWKAPVSFEESLKRTIDWQTKNPNWI